MAKHEFLQLAHVFDRRKHGIGGWFMSEKYDGQRAFWDGGVSRGQPSRLIPWANTEKDHIRVREPIATGLWSRYGNVIYAPDWWLDRLPPFFLDGELTAGRGRFQYTRSVVGDYNPGEGWKDIKMIVLDSPMPEVIFADRAIKNPPNYIKQFKGILDWLDGRFTNPVPRSRYVSFQDMYSWLGRNILAHENLELAPQIQLPFATALAEASMEGFMESIIDDGGEGVIIRKPSAMWSAHRVHDVLKYKPYADAEGTVVGYVWGRETDKGSKLLGLMGALVLDYNGKKLELSGFTNDERQMVFQPNELAENLVELYQEEGIRCPGILVSQVWNNPRFPIGSKVTFRYRELSDTGIPKEARYHRVRSTPNNPER